MRLLHPEEIAALDALAEREGLPPAVLMARAGAAVAGAARALAAEKGLAPVLPGRAGWTERVSLRAFRVQGPQEQAAQGGCGRRYLVFCGPGNNGGDGYAAALELAQRGAQVTAFDVFGRGQRTEAGQGFLQKAQAAGLVRPLPGERELLEQVRDACVLDAVFGTGARVPAGEEGILSLSRVFAAAGALLAVDVPLGVNAEDGTVADYAVRADGTVCLSCVKCGLLSYPAREYCGTLTVDDLGLPDGLFDRVARGDVCCPTREEVAALLPARPQNSHKGTFGRLFALVGSGAYPGAAALAAEAALRCGVGLVQVGSDPGVCQGVLVRLPEALLLPLAEGEETEAIRGADSQATAVLFGCGCGRGERTARRLEMLLQNPGGPLVLDADGLNALSDLGAERLREAARPVVVTPHPLEFARLTGRTVAQVQADRLNAARAFAAETGAVTVLKGAGTVVALPDGRAVLNPTGSSALAKGGSGDVLAGACAAFCAQGMPAQDAAAVAVYLHGAAGDRLERRFSQRGVLPSDLPAEMARQMAHWVCGSRVKRERKDRACF